MFIQAQLGLYKLGEWVGFSGWVYIIGCTLLAGTEVLGMLHLHEEKFQVFARERGS